MLKMYGKMNLILIMDAEKNQEESKKNQLLTLPVNVWLLRCRIDGTTESVMVAYTHKYAKV